jgi:signal transduction histidine kinase
MSNSQAVHPAALLRRLLRAQLRLKVMAGVVVVTLLALVAFDVGAVTTMRRYLLTQTDSNLQGALTLTLPRLAAALAFTNRAARASNHAVPGQVARPAHFKTPSLPGAFDMTFLPFHGQQVTLQVAAGGGYRWILSPAAAKVAARPGPHTLIGPNGRNQIRVQSLRAAGGSLVAGTSLDQVAKTIDEVDEVMDRIVLETRRMGRLVDDMLRLARLGQHPGRSAEPVDLTAVVAGCAERARIADPERTWRVRVGNGLGTVGDEELLRRAVDNLLMNVLVHTPAGTVGTITATTEGNRVAVEVSDDGPGVPPEALPHIFERFYRAGSQGTRGSGLGLAIAAEIAAAHGGTAEAARAFPRGLRIRLSLPGYASPRRIRTAAAASRTSA